MLIGVSSDLRANYQFDDKAWDFQREGVLYEANLPLEVVMCLNYIRERWKQNKEPPIAVQDFHGHGGNYGLVFPNLIHQNVNNKDFPEFGHTNWYVGSRISFGMDKKIYIENSSNTFKDPGKMNRLHISLCAQRNFLPLGKDEVKQPIDEDYYTFQSERINFSLRWLDKEFDGVWNDPNIWIKHIDSKHFEYPQFDARRTTYFSTKVSQDQKDTAGGIYSKKDVTPLLNRRKKVLPNDILLTKLMTRFPELSEKQIRTLYGESRKMIFPHVGFAPCLEILSQFGGVSPGDESIFKESMNEGITYLYGKVLPAMEAFVQC